jgi:hypothetical protein
VQLTWKSDAKLLSCMGLLLLGFCPTELLIAQSQYTITQVTSDPSDHQWPSINDNGDIVWSQQVNGFWQVFKNGAVYLGT